MKPAVARHDWVLKDRSQDEIFLIVEFNFFLSGWRNSEKLSQSTQNLLSGLTRQSFKRVRI